MAGYQDLENLIRIVQLARLQLVDFKYKGFLPFN